MLSSMLTTTDVLQGEPILALRVDVVDRMLAAGVIEDGERVELLHGLLVVMDVDGEAHVSITQRIMERLVIQLAGKPFKVICQSSAKMGDYQMPSPDIVVVPRQHGPGRYVGGLLVVEVADSSLHKDRDVKPSIYATAQVPEYWLVDVKAQQVVIHTEPLGNEYRTLETVPRTGVLSPIALPDVKIVIDELFRPED
jgi:Uma2 family endonuclease